MLFLVGIVPYGLKLFYLYGFLRECRKYIVNILNFLALKLYMEINRW